MRTSDGVTLIEVVVALLVFAVAGLALAVSSAAIARQVSSNALRARAVSIALSRAETAAAGPCSSLQGGQAAVPGISSSWTVSGATERTLDQRITRVDSRGVFTDRFMSAVSCQ